MYKIFLLDDNRLARRGLAKMIFSARRDCVLAGEGANGTVLMDYLNQGGKADVVITDVKMPLMDGVEVASILKEKYPQIAVIVISGFDDFSYVRQTLLNGAVDYLLKPVEQDALMAAIDRGITCAGQTDASNPIEDLYHAIVLEALLSGNTEGWKTWAETESFPAGTTFLLSCVEINIDLSDYDEKRLQFLHVLGALPGAGPGDGPRLLLACRYGLRAHLMFSCSDGIAPEAAETPVRALVNQLYSRVNLICRAGISAPFSSLDDAPRACAEAVRAVEELFYTGQTVLAFQPAMTPVGEDAGTVFVKRIERALLDVNMKEIQKTFRDYFTYGLAQRLKPEIFTRGVNKLLSMLTDQGDAPNAYSYFALEQYVFQVALPAQEQHLAQAHSPVAQALAFIDSHYGLPLTLTTLADQCFMNPSYLSTLFKKETGKSFTQYLMEVRISHAADMLIATDKRIQDVGADVGYPEPVSFSRAFKSVTGLSPAQYRDKLLGLDHP